MEKIISHDNEGNRITLEVNRKTEQSQEVCPEIVITNYGLFKLCVRRSQEEKQYAYGMGDKRYAKALGELAAKNREQYLEYQHKLEEELRNH